MVAHAADTATAKPPTLAAAVKHDPLLAGLIYCANCGAAM